MHHAGVPRGGSSAQVEVIPKPISVGDYGLTSRLSILGGIMAAGGCKVWLSGLGRGPQILCRSGW